MNPKDMRSDEELLEIRSPNHLLLLQFNRKQDTALDYQMFGLFPKVTFTGVFENRCLRCFPAANCSALYLQLGDDSGG